MNNILGVVTAVRGDGFFIQDPQPDGDPDTSDGVFVKPTGYCDPAVGNLILLPKAVVREFNPAGIGKNSLTITNLVAEKCNLQEKQYPVPQALVIGEGGRIPPSKIIENDTKGYITHNNSYDPNEDGLDFYESLEGMLVQVNNAIAVSTKNGYRNVSVVGDNGKYTDKLSSEGLMVIREGDFNPERLLLDDDFLVMPNIYVGAHFTKPIIGIVDYNFGEYNLEPTERLVYTQSKPSIQIVEDGSGENELSVVTYNVENLDPVARPDRLEVLADDIVHKLASPDLLALQEVMDNDGGMDSNVTSANETIKAIVSAIKAAGGPTYRWVNIDPIDDADGGVPGGNIRPVILYRADKGIEPTNWNPAKPNQALTIENQSGSVQLSNNPARLGIGNYFFNGSRKPLFVQFLYNGERFYVINCHLKSKSEDGPLYGEIQPPPLETSKQRNGQASLIASTISQILSIEPKARIILLGDLNDFPWTDPLKKLELSGLQNLFMHLPENERFTYSHSGMGQVLDHILISKALEIDILDFKVVHLNSMQLQAEQLSDHDPIYTLISWSN
ncbi:MAG TPA: endonuclease/exonuclease/phosphatase family protein [Anaerolineaceae bacterium]|nr:endonuclease/exonuclease/phosphatase family protein [Anaerolineaceae bacterium]